VCVLASAGVVYASSEGAFTVPLETLSPDDYVDPAPTPTAAAVALPEADTVPTGPLPNVVRIQQAINSVNRAGLGEIGLSVLSLDGTVLVSESADRPMTPASSLKVLSCLTALSILGPEHRFTTKVVSSSEGIILVGGGDPYLEYASDFGQDQGSIQQLADLTVAALGSTTSVALGYDDSLFAGPTWNTTWEDYSDDVTPISALWLDGGWTEGYHEPTPADRAAHVFAALLTDRGITVTSVASTKAHGAAKELAHVQSMPLRNIVARIVSVSDNSATEVVLRQASVASGGDGSFASAVAIAREVLTELGIWMPGMAMADGSGLSLSDWVPAQALARAVVVAHEDPVLSSVLVGFPVAGVSGTLWSRFSDEEEAGGRGVVHAKTGNHNGVCSLTGFVQTKTGGVVAFSIIANNSWDTWATQDWIDRVSTAIAAT
jgi:D-alanyl-D-alanine carboxypeptidase/D-alanyl-D-alanine-endopeptidase (penicillin-binding protein 4)